MKSFHFMFFLFFIFLAPAIHAKKHHANARQMEEIAQMSYPNIYKILTLDEYETFKQTQKFRGNPLDLKDGYMHFSTKKQYPAIIEKFFSGQKVVVLEINTETLNGKLKFEKNKAEGDLYPHLYKGHIEAQDVISVIKPD